MIAALEWQFGGLLRQWPAPVAWGVLAALGVGGVVFVWWTYRHTLRALRTGARVPLTILRAARWPTKVSSTTEPPAANQGMATPQDPDAGLPPPRRTPNQTRLVARASPRPANAGQEPGRREVSSANSIHGPGAGRATVVTSPP